MSASTAQLWPLLTRRAAEALEQGALLPIPTSAELIEDGGVSFHLRVVDSLRRKAEVKRAERAYAATTGTAINPFLPYDPALYVCDLGPGHVCLLNKFNVIDHHTLIVTRQLEAQEGLLDAADFEALWTCLLEIDGLGFYNGGETAGASQPHRHLQLVPLPLVPEGPRLPISAAFDRLPAVGEIGRAPRLPFLHAIAGVPPKARSDASSAARITLSLYDRLLAAVGLAPDRSPAGGRQAGPYNLLVCREWMMLVPRTREHFETVSLNALGFAGSYFLRDPGELARVKAVGPLQALASVAPPAQP